MKGNDPHNYGLTWKIRRDLSCDIVLPLPFYTPITPDELIIELDGYVNALRFIDILKDYGYSRPRIADLNLLTTLVIGVVQTYRRLLKLADADGKFYFKARVLNAWRMVPFVDIETVLNEFKAHGLPMVMDSAVTVPSGDVPDSFQLINEREFKQCENQELSVCLTQARFMFIPIAQAFGVPLLIEGETEDDVKTVSLLELFSGVGERAMTVQQNRITRHARI